MEVVVYLLIVGSFGFAGWRLVRRVRRSQRKRRAFEAYLERKEASIRALPLDEARRLAWQEFRNPLLFESEPGSAARDDLPPELRELCRAFSRLVLANSALGLVVDDVAPTDDGYVRLCAPFEHQYLAVRGDDERVFVCGDDVPDAVEADYPSFHHWALVQTAITAYDL